MRNARKLASRLSLALGIVLILFFSLACGLTDRQRTLGFLAVRALQKIYSAGINAPQYDELLKEARASCRAAIGSLPPFLFHELKTDLKRAFDAYVDAKAVWKAKLASARPETGLVEGSAGSDLIAKYKLKTTLSSDGKKFVPFDLAIFEIGKTAKASTDMAVTRLMPAY